MNSAAAVPVTINVSGAVQVSGLLHLPAHAHACFVFAHGAGAGMRHPFMASVANELEEQHIATLRYQFPYMEGGKKRPDPPALCHAAVRAAVLTAALCAPGLPLFAGGKSFGGRMTSQAQAAEPLPSVRGLGFLGFPLHPAGQPSDARAQHLTDVKVPMLFLQGTRDALADLALLRPLVKRLGKRATLIEIQDADHSYHVRARAGVTDAQILARIVRNLVEWMGVIIGSSAAP